MSYSLPVHLLRQHRFCPRIPWFQEVLEFRPPRPEWVRQGEKFDQQQQRLFSHRTMKRFALDQAERIFHDPVSSDTLLMHGIVDCTLLTANAVYPVEIKLAGKRPRKGHTFQLAAYGMLLEEKYSKPVPRGFILMNQRGTTWPIEITQEIQNQVCQVRDIILEQLQNSGMPESSANHAQCIQCEYLNYCNDR